MLYALDQAGERVEPSPGMRGTCPTCRGAVQAKCGEILVWHWSHTADAECDPWAEHDSDWHRGWQMLAPPERREVVIGEHRADIMTSSGWVVELQHSSISPEEIATRERFYGPQMMWLFDVTEAHYNGRFALRRREGYYSFRWKHPRKSIDWCRRRVLLDLGVSGVLSLRKINTEAPCGGWGKLLHDGVLEAWLAGA